MSKKAEYGDEIVCLVNKGAFSNYAIYTVEDTSHVKGAIKVLGMEDWLYEDEYLVVKQVSDSLYEPIKDDSSECKGVNLHEDALNSKSEETGLIDKQEHYTANGIQPIDLMRQNFTPEAFQGFLEGNIIKYVLRHRRKNGVEDLRKAMTYLTWLIDEEENE